MILYMYIHVASGQGLTTPRGRNFYVNRNILSLWSFVASFKKNLFEVWFYAICFMILYMYIAPGQGQTAPRGQSFNVNRNVLSFHSFDASFQKNAFEVWFYTICFMIKYMYIAPGQGQTAPRGQNLDVNRKALSLYPFVQVSKKSLWSLILYFFMI